MFNQKCEAKNIREINIKTLEEQVVAAKHFWAEQLSHQIPNLRPFDEFAIKVTEIMRHIVVS